MKRRSYGHWLGFRAPQHVSRHENCEPPLHYFTVQAGNMSSSSSTKAACHQPEWWLNQTPSTSPLLAYYSSVLYPPSLMAGDPFLCLRGSAVLRPSGSGTGCNGNRPWAPRTTQALSTRYLSCFRVLVCGTGPSAHTGSYRG